MIINPTPLRVMTTDEVKTKSLKSLYPIYTKTDNTRELILTCNRYPFSSNNKNTYIDNGSLSGDIFIYLESLGISKNEFYRLIKIGVLKHYKEIDSRLSFNISEPFLLTTKPGFNPHPMLNKKTGLYDNMLWPWGNVNCVIDGREQGYTLGMHTTNGANNLCLVEIDSDKSANKIYWSNCERETFMPITNKIYQ